MRATCKKVKELENTNLHQTACNIQFAMGLGRLGYGVESVCVKKGDLDR
jgi:hypothetical protein